MSSSLDALLKVSWPTSLQKLFAYDCITLYIYQKKKTCKHSVLRLCTLSTRHLRTKSSQQYGIGRFLYGPDGPRGATTTTFVISGWSREYIVLVSVRKYTIFLLCNVSLNLKFSITYVQTYNVHIFVQNQV